MDKKERKQYDLMYKKISAALKREPPAMERDDLSDDDYFVFCLENDILTNAYSLVANILYDNFMSPGIDNNCRAIMEAFSLLDDSKLPNTYIDDSRKKLFKLSYAPVEHYNNEHAFNILYTNKSNLPYGQSELDKRSNDINSFCQLATNCFGRSITPQTDKIKMPDFCFNKTYGKSFNYKKSVNDYYSANHKIKNIYTFFSNLIHPSSSIGDYNQFVPKDVEQKRKSYSDLVLNRVINYFETKWPDLDYSAIDNFDVSINKIDNGILIISQNMKTVGNFLSKYHCGTFDLFNKLGSLLKDLVLCFGLHNYSSAVSKYKSATEISAVLLYILFFNGSQEDLNLRLDGFICSSRLRIFSLDSQAKIKNEDNSLFTLVSNLYDKYLQHNFIDAATTLDDFIKNMSSYCYYSLDCTCTMVKPFVEKQINDFLKTGDVKLAEDILNIYDVSLDAEHGFGFATNSSGYSIISYTIKSIDTFAKLLLKITDIKDFGKIEAGKQSVFFIQTLIKECKHWTQQLNTNVSRAMKQL